MSEQQWTEITAKTPNSEAPTYLNPRPNEPVIIRFVGRPFAYLKWWSPLNVISPGRDQDVCWQESGCEPQQRYASWCIDRADGRAKIICVPQMVASTLGEWSKGAGRKAGDRVSPDFKLTMVSEGTSTWWRVEVGRNDTPVSDDEVKVLTRAIGQHKLAELYACASPEKIRELWAAAKQKPSPAPTRVEPRDIWDE